MPAISGTTNDVDAVVFSYEFRSGDSGTLMIKNTHDVNSLDVRIVSKAVFAGGIENLELDWTTLTPLSLLKYVQKDTMINLAIHIKNTSAGNNAAFMLESLCGR